MLFFVWPPLDDNEARKMIDELHAQKLLSAFRGEKAPDKDALIKALVGLSRISMEIPDIKEIDINLIIGDCRRQGYGC